MSRKPPSRLASSAAFLLLVISSILSVWGDQVQMQNGDRYIGRLVALTNDTLVVQSDILGTLRLPRAKVASIVLGSVAGTNKVHLTEQSVSGHPLKSPPIKTDSQFSFALNQLESGTNSVRQIQQQFLSDAGPEANKRFAELAEGLMTGKVSLADLRAQAASAAEQLRALKREGGGELGGALDGYLAILDNFLKETPATQTSLTNRPTQVRKSKNEAVPEEE
jgi:hypothetical protein